jgi:uncharacterized protein YjiK
MKSSHLTSLAVTITCCIAPLHAGLLITEINSNGSGGDFWELTNTGASPVVLDGYQWNDSARSTTGAVTIPAGTTIAVGESVVFAVSGTAEAFRAAWGIPASVKVISTGPGLGQNDAITLFDSSGTEVLYLSYELNGFTRSDGSGAAGGHAGASAGGTAAVSMVWDPGFGTASPRYTAATAGSLGCFTHTTAPATIGSPGVSGFGGEAPSITLSLSADPASFSESAGNPASTGTVTRSGATTTELIVSLSSSDVTEANVPATVTIAANQTSATFPIIAVDDTFPDGNKVATLTASAADSTSGTTEVTVLDDGDVITSNLLLTEIQSNQASAAAGTEDYWELTNFGESAVSLAGYSWHDGGRSAAAAAAYALPPGASIAPGESVVFTSAAPADFRTWWGIAESVQVFQSPGSPGLGQGDGISFFDETGNEFFFFSYAEGGFTKEDGTASTGGHAGPSAGGSLATQALVWVPTSGTETPRYTAALGGNHGTFQATSGADFGSPGVTVGLPTVSIGDASLPEGNSGTTTLTLMVSRSNTDTAFTVDYAVTGGSATADVDYVALAAGTLTFTADGPASLPINLSINGDTEGEPDETILITLTNIINTTATTVLGTAVGTGTIVNDDIVTPAFVEQPASTTVGSGTATTLTVSASGFPAPDYQWYQGERGDISTPVGTNSNTFTTPSLATTTSFWVRINNGGSPVDSETVTITVVPGVTTVNLSTYVRIGRYDLPEPTRTALPPGTAAHNLLCQEASGVAYNWDTDTLFIVCDGGRSVTQVSKTGELIDTMSLALRAGAPQGTDFYDPEGVAYIGNGQFVLAEERDRQLVKFTYVAGTTISRADTQTVKIGTFDDNTGTEGLSWDPITNGFIVLKEKNPIGVFQTGIDFAAGTATNGSPTAANSVNLFDTTLLGMTDVADVFALSNLPSMDGQPQHANLLVIGQEDARVVNISRTGEIHSTLQIVSDPGNPLSAGDQQHEGVTMDRAGNLYIVNENGGGNINFPQLWVYAPSSVPNAAPTAITLNNPLNSIIENTSTASRIKVGDLVITDDGLGVNTVTLSGTDAAFFEIISNVLFIKAGTTLDYETKTSYSITLNVDDVTIGTTPDATLDFTLTVIDQEFETPAPAALIVTEVAPWSSGNSPVAGDWFEVTNISENPVNITGWKVDDDTNSFGVARDLLGVTTIAPGESVIFIEATDLPAKTTAFLNNWFGSNPPAGLQIGSYTGSGIGLSTGGDAVNLFNASGVLHSRVSFGSSSGLAPYATFDNTIAVNDPVITTLSVPGVNGAFIAANSPDEIGSPGYSAPGVLRVTEVAPWSSGNSPVAADWFEVTNTGARAVTVTGWKVDDSSESPAAALPLTGIDRIEPGESVIFMETSDLPTKAALFKSNWFGAFPPDDLQIGGYSGSGIGLSTGGDAVNLYDTNNVRRVNVSFAIAPSVAPFSTFDNSAAANVAAITQFSAVGVNGAFSALNSSIEIGSPGAIANPTSFDFGTWIVFNGFSSSGFDADNDGDGASDGLEFFFGQNPNLAGDLGNLPAISKVGADHLLTFTTLDNVTGVTGTLQRSTDLGQAQSWAAAILNVDYEIASEVSTNGKTTTTLRLLGQDPAKFWRHRIATN